MPSPFPGMDPYIESQLWLNFHGDIAVEAKRQLAAVLGEKYYPFTIRYNVVEYLDNVAIATTSLVPDVGITPQGGDSHAQAVATMVNAPAQMKVRIPAPIPHYRIEIRDVENRELVTVIEFLSPTNKTGLGRKKYLKKRRRLLMSSAHLVEVDLLLQGKRLPMIDPYPPGDYFILLSREERRPYVDAWPICLDQTLPTFNIPLLDGDPDVHLNLQETVQKVYELGRYDRILDYRRPLTMALTPDQKAILGRFLPLART